MENVGAASAQAVAQQRKGRGRGRLEEEEVADGWVPHGRERKGKVEAGWQMLRELGRAGMRERGRE